MSFTPQFYPYLNVILAITQDFNATITLGLPVNYVVDEIISFRCPSSYGMPQINGLSGKIIRIDTVLNTITVNVNTLSFDPFVFGPPFDQLPQTIPAGELGTLDASVKDNTIRPGYTPV